MKVFIKKIQQLVEQFASYNDSTNQYQEKIPLTNKTRQTIEADMMDLINNFLLKDGFDIDAINRNHKCLSRLFHPDKMRHNTIPALQWLVNSLSENQDIGKAFNLVNFCYKKLTTANEPATPPTQDISGLSELEKNIQHKNEQAQTLTEKAMYQCIQTMLSTIRRYNTGVIRRIPTSLLQTAIANIPYFSSGCCVGFFINELAIIFATTYLISTGSAWLAKSQDERWKTLGTTIYNYNITLQQVSVGFVTSMTAINFYALHRIGSTGFDIGRRIFAILTGAAKPDISPPMTSTALVATSSASFFQPQITMTATMPKPLLPQDLLGGEHFTNLPLKLIALSLESYCQMQPRQFLSSWRAGYNKNLAMQNALHVLKLIDNDREDTVEEKLKRAKLLMLQLGNNQHIASKTDGKSRHAVYTALDVCDILLANKTDDPSYTSEFDLHGQQPPQEHPVMLGSSSMLIEDYSSARMS